MLCVIDVVRRADEIETSYDGYCTDVIDDTVMCLILAIGMTLCGYESPDDIVFKDDFLRVELDNLADGVRYIEQDVEIIIDLLMYAKDVLMNDLMKQHPATTADKDSYMRYLCYHFPFTDIEAHHAEFRAHMSTTSRLFYIRESAWFVDSALDESKADEVAAHLGVSADDVRRSLEPDFLKNDMYRCTLEECRHNNRTCKHLVTNMRNLISFYYFRAIKEEYVMWLSEYAINKPVDTIKSLIQIRYNLIYLIGYSPTINRILRQCTLEQLLDLSITMIGVRHKSIHIDHIGFTFAVADAAFAEFCRTNNFLM